MERSRTLSTSGPVPNGDGEAMKDTDVQMQPAPQNETENSKAAQPSQESPRRCEGPVRTSSPASAMACSCRLASPHRMWKRRRSERAINRQADRME